MVTSKRKVLCFFFLSLSPGFFDVLAHGSHWVNIYGIMTYIMKKYIANVERRTK